MADLTTAIPMLRDSAVAVLRIHTKRPEITKKGKTRPAEFQLSGSAFYRNKENSLDGLWQFLDNEGIEPLFYKEERHDDGTEANEDADNNKQAATDFENEVHPEDEEGKTINHDAIKEVILLKYMMWMMIEYMFIKLGLFIGITLVMYHPFRRLVVH